MSSAVATFLHAIRTCVKIVPCGKSGTKSLLPRPIPMIVELG